MKKKMTEKVSILGLVAITGFFLMLDQVSKFLAVKYLEVSLNEGIAFGVKIGRFFIIALTGILILVLLRMILSEFNLRKWPAKVISGMILGGAVGNLIDRIYLGQVIDFIRLPYWPTFNLADVFIVLGVILGFTLYKSLKSM
ncbi:MAG TPA: signal peptidase II [Candidatus Gracilibacteria bacterium]|nr:signal peptidase II [Candidatus Gracilibacteria bacterium]